MTAPPSSTRSSGARKAAKRRPPATRPAPDPSSPIGAGVDDPDRSPRVEAASDAATDAASDAATDAASDAATDTATDAAPDADDGSPRYVQIARDLKQAIADGRFPIGSRLPTEVELCAQFGISRFTAREALRLLLAAGLITRRQRVGTVVVARPDEARYAQDASSIPDLLQYAQDTQLRLVYIGRIGLGAQQARDFGATPGEEWVYALGIRTPEPDGPAGDGSVPVLDTRPFCITRVFLNPLLDGIEVKLRERRGAVYALIEREYKLTIARVEQELSGTVLGADDAANLGTAVGAPALRIVRRYYDDRDRLLEVADNLHPTDRFSYRMQLKR